MTLINKLSYSVDEFIHRRDLLSNRNVRVEGILIAYSFDPNYKQNGLIRLVVGGNHELLEPQIIVKPQRKEDLLSSLDQYLDKEIKLLINRNVVCTLEFDGEVYSLE